MTTLKQFGGVGDNSTNNDVALTNALASTEEPIEIPEGSFVTSKTQDELTDKKFVGPGTIATPGFGTPGNYVRMTHKGTALGQSLYGDFSKVEIEKFILDSNVRKGVSEAYYEYATTPHAIELNVRSGGSGFLGTTVGLTAQGASSMTLTSVGECTISGAAVPHNLVIGDSLLFDGSTFSDGVANSTTTYTSATANFATTDVGLAFTGTNIPAGTTVASRTNSTTIVLSQAATATAGSLSFHIARPVTTVTVTGFDAGSKTVNFNPVLAHPAASGTTVINANRTMNQAYLGSLFHIAGGDAYIYGGKVYAYHDIPDGVTNFEQNSTAGFLGGDLNASAEGVYLTPFEFQCNDNGHDIAVIGGVQSFSRTKGSGNGGGQYGCIWMGHYIASQGSQPMDVGYYLSGPVNVGFDTVEANCTSGCAYGMAQNQYIHFTNTASGTTGVLIGDTIGNTKFGYNSSTGKVELTVGGVLMLSASSTNVTLAGDLASAGSAWTAYTPSAVSSGGAITTLGAHTGRYRKVGKTVNLQTSVNIVANGSADTSIVESLPFQAANAQYVLNVVDTTTGIGGRAIIGANANSLEIKKYDNTYLGGDGATLVVTGVYETA